jgi:hypothetical protein
MRCRMLKQIEIRILHSILLSLVLGLGLISSASASPKIDHSIINSAVPNVEDTVSPRSDHPDNLPNSQKVSDFPSGFLDERQAQLFAQVSHELSDYIDFADPVEFSKTNRFPFEVVLKQWTQQEKEKIEEAFDAILHRAPGLLLAACGNNKLVLCRTTSMKGSRGLVTQMASGLGVIVVADASFRMPRQLSCLTHELLHLSDSANHLSSSADWAKFANPPIALMNRRIKRASPRHRAALNRLLKQDDVFPSTEGYSNLREAFACYFTEYIEGSTFPCDPNQVERFGPHFLHPTPQELRFTEHFVNGQVAICAKDLDLAFTEFCAAKELDPSVARVYLSLSAVTRHDLKQSLEYCREACDAFEAASVPRTDYYALAIATKRYLERSLNAGPGHIVKRPEAGKYLNGN